jgi:hypothetical protein
MKRQFLVRVGAMAEDGKFRIEKFNEQNYQLWKMQMEDYLYRKDVFLPFGGIAKNSTSMKDEEWEVLNRKALGMIRLILVVSMAFNISKEKTMKELMDTLDKMYEKPSASNKVFLMKRLCNMKMSKGGSVVNHLNEFNTVTNQLSSVKVVFDDEVRALLILCSLSESWNGLVMVLSNSFSGSNTLKFDDVIGVILSEEMRRKSTDETSSNALNMENKGRQKDRGKGSRNHGNSRKGKSKSRLGNIECWNCWKKGHLKKNCRAPKKQRDGQQEKNEEANVIGDVLQDALILSVDNIYESWVVDSGASFHATPHRKHFLDYVQGDFGQVQLGDDAPCKIVGMGKVKIKQKNGNQRLLKEVRHVPDLRKNLISIGKLESEGCISIFTNKAWKFTKGSLVVAKAEKVGTLYLCTGNINSSISLASTRVDTGLWHRRLGHMSEKAMQILHKRNFFQILNKLIWISVNIVFMENRRDSDFSDSEKKRRVKG